MGLADRTIAGIWPDDGSSKRAVLAVMLRAQCRTASLCLAVAVLLIVTPLALGDTPVETDITVPITFTAALSPYIILPAGGITVQSTGSLTIQAGVTVKRLLDH